MSDNPIIELKEFILKRINKLYQKNLIEELNNDFYIPDLNILDSDLDSPGAFP